MGFLPQYSLSEGQIHLLPESLIVELERFLIFDVKFRPFLWVYYPDHGLQFILRNCPQSLYIESLGPKGFKYSPFGLQPEWIPFLGVKSKKTIICFNQSDLSLDCLLWGTLTKLKYVQNQYFLSWVSHVWPGTLLMMDVKHLELCKPKNKHSLKLAFRQAPQSRTYHLLWLPSH